MARQPLISHIVQITHGTKAELKKACIAMQQCNKWKIFTANRKSLQWGPRVFWFVCGKTTWVRWAGNLFCLYKLYSLCAVPRHTPHTATVQQRALSSTQLLSKYGRQVTITLLRSVPVRWLPGNLHAPGPSTAAVAGARRSSGAPWSL